MVGTGADGKRLYHKKIVGTVERYPDQNAARRPFTTFRASSALAQVIVQKLIP